MCAALDNPSFGSGCCVATVWESATYTLGWSFAFFFSKGRSLHGSKLI